MNLQLKRGNLCIMDDYETPHKLYAARITYLTHLQIFCRVFRRKLYYHDNQREISNFKFSYHPPNFCKLHNFIAVNNNNAVDNAAENTDTLTLHEKYINYIMQLLPGLTYHSHC